MTQFLNLSIIGFEAQKMPCYRTLFLCRMFTSISDLHTLDANSTVPSGDNQNHLQTLKIYSG